MNHPGTALLENFMRPLGLTANQVALGLGVNRSTVGRLIAGVQRITPQMAARLGAYFQVPAKWWLQMQTGFDAAEIARRPSLREGVTPLELDCSLLVTPSGVLQLDEPEGPEPPLSIAGSEFESSSVTSTPQAREVTEIRYESGSIALVGSGS